MQVRATCGVWVSSTIGNGPCPLHGQMAVMCCSLLTAYGTSVPYGLCLPLPFIWPSDDQLSISTCGVWDCSTVCTVCPPCPCIWTSGGLMPLSSCSIWDCSTVWNVNKLHACIICQMGWPLCRSCMHALYVIQHGSSAWVAFMPFVLDCMAPLNVSCACIGVVACVWGGQEGIVLPYEIISPCPRYMAKQWSCAAVYSWCIGLRCCVECTHPCPYYSRVMVMCCSLLAAYGIVVLYWMCQPFFCAPPLPVHHMAKGCSCATLHLLNMALYYYMKCTNPCHPIWSGGGHVLCSTCGIGDCITICNLKPLAHHTV